MTKIFCDHCGKEIKDNNINELGIDDCFFDKDFVGYGCTLCGECWIERRKAHIQLDKIFLNIAEQKSMCNIKNSIIYAIRNYEYRNHKPPDKILVNNACYVKLIDILSYNILDKQKYNDTIETIFSIPISRDSKDVIDIPRFYLCEEGIIYNI